MSLSGYHDMNVSNILFNNQSLFPSEFDVRLLTFWQKKNKKKTRLSEVCLLTWWLRITTCDLQRQPTTILHSHAWACSNDLMQIARTPVGTIGTLLWLFLSGSTRQRSLVGRENGCLPTVPIQPDRAWGTAEKNERISQTPGVQSSWHQTQKTK